MINILADAINEFSEGIIIAQLDGNIQYVNERLLQLTNLDKKIDFAGKSMENILRIIFSSCGVSEESLEANVTKILNSAESEFKVTRRDGAVLIFDKKELSSGVLLFTVKDITHLSQIESKQKQIIKVAIMALADLSEYRDQQTGDHVLRVARMTYEIARSLKKSGEYKDILTTDFLYHIGIASILHDIGKVSLPDSILYKPGPLDAVDRKIMQKHTINGSSILKKANRSIGDNGYFRLASEIAESHHEYWDGTGYPNGLSENNIPLSARIVAVTDVYDALIQPRPYKDSWAKEKVISYIKEKSGFQFDPKVVDGFLDVMKMRENAAFLEWSSDMSVSNTMIDHDHQILLTLINQLINDENRSDRLAVEFVMDELINYAFTHFKREEQLMKEMEYPELDNHRKIHDLMTSEVIVMQKKLNIGFTPALGEEVSLYLKKWLSIHILREDKKYSLFLQNKDFNYSI
jgi:hemerythrin-like metal-binding protein